MPVPTHFRFVFRGRFQDTPEEWSFGVKFSRNVPLGGDADLSAINETTVTNAVLALFASSRFQGHIAGVDWRAYVIGTNGKMEGSERLLVDLSASGLGGTSGTKYPPQVALVATLVASERGPARLGRIFLPAPAAVLGDDYRISEAICSDYANDVSTFLKAVSNGIDLPATIESSAGLNISAVGGGVRQVIDHVEVGRVYDTMRSRRQALLEDRVADSTIDW